MTALSFIHGAQAKNIIVEINQLLDKSIFIPKASQERWRKDLQLTETF